MRVFREPVSLEAIGVNEILRTLYGKQWSFQVLFTPRDLPEQVVNSLTKGLMEVGVINESEYVSFFEKYRFFGLGGKKLQIEMEKAKKRDS
ncbi:MAG: hypothetical protein NXH75_11910 [Halobacteriovoraceae bacterium]|nr:hypothetical protein [Halobacteriovoraceae bacterium]